MFNAIKYTEELKKAGFSPDQADVSMKVLIDVMNENFATKSDIAELKSATKADMRELEAAMKVDTSAMKADIAELRTELRSEIAGVKSEFKALEMKFDSGFRELEYKLTIKLGALMGTMVTLAVGVTATIVKLLQVSG